MRVLCVYIIIIGVMMGFGCFLRYTWINCNRFCVQDNPKKVLYGRINISGGLFNSGITNYSLGYSGINSNTQKECVSWQLVTEAEYSRHMYEMENQ